MNLYRHPHSHFAVTRARAARRQATLKGILPRSIADLVSVARSGTIWYRGVIIGDFLPGSRMIATRDRKVISVSDHKSLTQLFRGVLFPADYDDARTALDAHEARAAAWKTGDDAAAQAAEKTLRALRREPIVVG